MQLNHFRSKEMSSTPPFLAPRKANFAPLSPLTFLERAGTVYPEKLAIVHGEIRRSYGEYYDRVLRVSTSLKEKCDVREGDNVAVMLSNTPEMLEMHFSVPLVGGCLCSINTRLDPAGIAFILNHADASVLVWDAEFDHVIERAIKILSKGTNKIRAAVRVLDREYKGPASTSPFSGFGPHVLTCDYEDFVDMASFFPRYRWCDFPGPSDEWDSIALNYTSGTTGDPKGVLLHHRGAYLNSIGNILSWNMKNGGGIELRYLWTLPMFHCNGWCFPWTIPALAGTHVCLRSVNASAIFNAIHRYKVTHFCGAPIIMQMIINAPEEERLPFSHEVSMMTAAAPPPAPVLAAMKEQHIDITHVYGLSEVYGPAVVCSWHDDWDKLDSGQQAIKKSRQGVRYSTLENLMVADAETLVPVPRDGKTIGEIFMRGNIVMKGYLKNEKTTEKAFSGGWFHTGDLAVWHEDGYVQIADRSKDIIISGGENISSVEIQDVLYAHSGVQDAAVVARPDEKWGETPCAFVELKPGAVVTEEELSQFCKDRLAGFKRPRTFVFGPLPKTATGKIQKFILRQKAKELGTGCPQSRL